MEIQYFEFLKHLIRFNRYVYLDHNATTPERSRVQRKKYAGRNVIELRPGQ